jgi:hypothetical protein
MIHLLAPKAIVSMKIDENGQVFLRSFLPGLHVICAPFYTSCKHRSPSDKNQSEQKNSSKGFVFMKKICDH